MVERLLGEGPQSELCWSKAGRKRAGCSPGLPAQVGQIPVSGSLIFSLLLRSAENLSSGNRSGKGGGVFALESDLGISSFAFPPRTGMELQAEPLPWQTLGRQSCSVML